MANELHFSIFGILLSHMLHLSKTVPSCYTCNNVDTQILYRSIKELYGQCNNQFNPISNLDPHQESYNHVNQWKKKKGKINNLPRLDLWRWKHLLEGFGRACWMLGCYLFQSFNDEFHLLTSF